MQRDKFLRPVLVYKKFNSNQFLGFVLTSKEHINNSRFYYKISKESFVILSQIKTYSAKRIEHKTKKKISKNKLREVYKKLVSLITPQEHS